MGGRYLADHIWHQHSQPVGQEQALSDGVNSGWCSGRCVVGGAVGGV